jgi:hypothetical protein
MGKYIKAASADQIDSSKIEQHPSNGDVSIVFVSESLSFDGNSYEEAASGSDDSVTVVELPAGERGGGGDDLLRWLMSNPLAAYSFYLLVKFSVSTIESAVDTASKKLGESFVDGTVTAVKKLVSHFSAALRAAMSGRHTRGICWFTDASRSVDLIVEVPAVLTDAQIVILLELVENRMRLTQDGSYEQTVFDNEHGLLLTMYSHRHISITPDPDVRTKTALVELYRVRALIEQGLAKPDEKGAAIRLAQSIAGRSSDDVVQRKAEKLIRSTQWSKSTHDGFVAPDEANHLDPWIGLLEETLEEPNSPPPTSLRFSKGEPATNVLNLVEILKGSTVNAVFDPFLDSRGMKRLLSLHKAGTAFANQLRCLTSGKAEQVDDLLVQDAFKQMRIKGEVRVTGSKEDHRRFLLLDGDKVLILGNSLNDFDKDEAAHLESSKHDHEFFARVWDTAQPMKVAPPKAGIPKTRPVIDFASGGFIHTGGSSGRRVVASLCNQGDAPAMSVEMRFEADDSAGQGIGTEFPIPTLRPGESTPGNIVIDYAGCPLGTTLLSNPRIVFKATDMYGNIFESMRSLVQESRNDGGYNLRAGSAFWTL